MVRTTKPKYCKSCDQKLPARPPSPPPSTCETICMVVLSLLWLAGNILFLVCMLSTCDLPRLNLESLSVSADDARAAEWHVSFSITDDPKTTLPLLCRSYGNGNVEELHVSVVYSVSRDIVRFEKYVTPFEPRNGEVISLNTTIYSLLPPPPTIINQGLSLEFEVGIVATSFRWRSFSELHCRNMTVSFSPHAAKGNVIKGGGGGPPFDCDHDREIKGVS